jgi:DNA repair exonuclease SbcCD nuclease subunit
MHQTVEGATVGPGEFTFRSGLDVIPGRAVPGQFAAVLAGHIHRHQVLRTDLEGTALASPVIYPGSTERTSFAERAEAKGYLILDLSATPDGRGTLVGYRFVELPTSPMVHLELDVAGRSAAEVQAVLCRDLARLPPDSIVRVSVRGRAGHDVLALLGAPALRRLAPGTMSINPGGLRRQSAGSAIRSRT